MPDDLTVAVQFTRRSRVASGIYNAGEKAAFPREVALSLIKAGAAAQLPRAKEEPAKFAEGKP